MKKSGFISFTRNEFYRFFHEYGYNERKPLGNGKQDCAICNAISYGNWLWMGERLWGKSENHYTVINDKGEIISDYAKIHPFSFAGEDHKFRGGDNIVTFELNGIRFSTFICYDLRFPEVFQIASKDSQVIIVPADWPEKRKEHWQCLLRARAIENQIYIIAVNCVGEIGGVHYSGDSCIVDPDGKVLAGLSGQEGILEYNLINDVNCFRNSFQVKNDRREDLYYKKSLIE